MPKYMLAYTSLGASFEEGVIAMDVEIVRYD